MVVLGRSSEKSPVRMAAVGTVEMYVCAWVTRLPSKSAKKNNRFLPLNRRGMYTGPPRFAPNSFIRNGGIGAVGESKKFFASNAELRTNSYAAPCTSLVPDRKVTFTTAGPP